MNTWENIFENARSQIKKACSFFEYCNNNLNNYEFISYPKRIIEVNLPILMDNWQIRTFTWYRSQHNDSRWAFKWWIRFHQDVSIWEVKALSMWMTFKCSLADIPLWWAKGWIIVDPKELSEIELERLSRAYVWAIYKNIWSDIDVPAPDVNTNSKIMAWMTDEYSKLAWKFTPASFTWKPLEIWGSLWRWSATAQWWFYVLQKFLELRWDNIFWKKIIIQWAWNAWLIFADIVNKSWAIIIWISDSKWAIYNEKGLDISKIIDIKKSNKSVIEYIWADIVWDKDFLEKEADILVPAALENQITEKNASNIKAKLILELANGPISPEADEILWDNWIDVIPDILANSWWVIVSYFEQVQNNMNYYWDEKEVFEKLYKKIVKSTEEVYLLSNKYNTNFRNLAYIISIKRLLDSMKARWEIL